MLENWFNNKLMKYFLNTPPPPTKPSKTFTLNKTRKKHKRLLTTTVVSEQNNLRHLRSWDEYNNVACNKRPTEMAIKAISRLMQKAIKVAIEQIKGWHATRQTGRQTGRQSLIISLILATMIIFELGSILMSFHCRVEFSLIDR